MSAGERTKRHTRVTALVVSVVVVAPVLLAAFTVPVAGAPAVADGPTDGAQTGGVERPGDVDETGRTTDVGSGAAVDDAGRTDAPPTRCFDGDGYPLSIGNGSATIDAVIHLSVLTDPAAGNEFGVELAGSVDRDPIVTLAAGVRLTAPGTDAVVSNPFAAFDLLYAYELRLPMFEGAVDDSEHREDRPPVGSPAGSVPC